MSGLACLFALFLCAPVSPDPVTGKISINAALAGSGDGNYGRGRGNGGPNGQNPGNGGGVGAGGSAGGGGSDNQDGDNTGDPPRPTPGSGAFDDNSGGVDEAAELADENFDQAIDAAGALAAEGAPAGPDVIGLPTVQELFTLGEGAVVPAAEELRLIANGWKPQD